MNTSEILTSIQTQLAIILPSEDIKEPTTFYNDLISEMPYSESISSFLIGVDTNHSLSQDSNLTLITFEEVPNEDISIEDINEYMKLKLNSGHEFTELTWLNNILIIAFDF